MKNKKIRLNKNTTKNITERKILSKFKSEFPGNVLEKSLYYKYT